jgi:hypothetical protein
MAIPPRGTKVLLLLTTKPAEDAKQRASDTEATE